MANYLVKVRTLPLQRFLFYRNPCSVSCEGFLFLGEIGKVSLKVSLTEIEEHILDLLLIQKPRKEIAKGLDITTGSLNTYINRMTAKNNCNLVGLIHRYIV